MTEQYARQNINDPEGSRTIVAPAGPSGIFLSQSDAETLVVVDTTAGGLTVGMPPASSVSPGTKMTVLAATAATNPASIGITAGDVLVVPPGIGAAMSTDDASRTVVSDGNLTWYIVDGLD